MNRAPLRLLVVVLGLLAGLTPQIVHAADLPDPTDPESIVKALPQIPPDAVPRTNAVTDVTGLAACDGRDRTECLLPFPNDRFTVPDRGTATGRRVGALAGEHLKKVSLELGGNNALIVLDDADIDGAASSGAWGSFLHQGQICLAVSRHLVHESIAEEYLAALTERAARRIGEILGREPAGAMLRLSVEGGGCSGFQYKFDVDRAKAEDDLVIERDSAVVLVDPASVPFLASRICTSALSSRARMLSRWRGSSSTTSTRRTLCDALASSCLNASISCSRLRPLIT